MSSKANGPPRSVPDPTLDAQLQKRAIEKFGPGSWKVTRRSLQQATPWQVARLKASWFGNEMVYDLCCGIGGDALELARRGPLIAIDDDSELVACVRRNLTQVSGVDSATASCADVCSVALPAGASIHIDPDRRTDQHRTVKPDRYRPDWNAVCRIVSTADAAIIKLAPAAEFDPATIGQLHRCWISLRRTVREQSVLVGKTIDRAGLMPGQRSAVSIRSDGTTIWFRPQAIDDAAIETVEQPMRLLIDPDPAIRAAGLTETFARDYDLRLLHQASGFLTADTVKPAVSEIAVASEVVWFGPCDDRKLRREFRTRDVFPETIKVRGTDHNPSVLTKRYRKCGQQPVTLWIGRAGKRVFAAITN